MLYDSIGNKYQNYRRPDYRIAAAISNCFSGATKIVNIGAGVGSYEPIDRRVVAVEPSSVMISQRLNNPVSAYMPPKSPTDAPRAQHHIVAKGIERK